MSKKKNGPSKVVAIPEVVIDEDLGAEEDDILGDEDELYVQSEDRQEMAEEEHFLPVQITDGSLQKSLDELDGLDPLKVYIKQISRYDLLSLEQEKVLVKALLDTGDIEVAKKLVLANLRLVVKIALEYRKAYANVMDLIQEGNVGLMKAVSKYDPSKGAKLSYYSSWWIRSYILKFILDNFRLVKIGTTQEQKRLFYHLMREKQRLESMGIRPETKLLSANLGVSEKAVAEMDQRLSSSGSELSLDHQYGDENGGSVSLMDLLDDGSDGMDDQLSGSHDLQILKDHLKDFVTGLKPRDKEIFEKRLLSDIPPSLQSIADEYGVSRERIRQVEERLIAQLKVYMSKYLR